MTMTTGMATAPISVLTDTSTSNTPVLNPDQYRISPAKAGDLEEIAALVNSAYRGESSRQGWTTEADFLDGQRTDPYTLAYELSSDEGRVILCLREADKSEIIACVQLSRFVDEDGVGCSLGMLTVKPTIQAGGIGRLLLAQAEEYAKAWGANRVVLCVIQLRESLMAWYERRGYQKTKKTQCFPFEIASAGIPKRDDLHFVIFEKTLA